LAATNISCKSTRRYWSNKDGWHRFLLISNINLIADRKKVSLSLGYQDAWGKEETAHALWNMDLEGADLTFTLLWVNVPVLNRTMDEHVPLVYTSKENTNEIPRFRNKCDYFSFTTGHKKRQWFASCPSEWIRT
jgi:hypothetical protein